MKKYNVAVVGATGNVGREILNILDDRNFPINKIYAVASSKSEGLKISYGNEKEIEIGSPTVQGAKVEANLIKNSKNRTILIFKKRRWQNSRRKNGHRQQYSMIRINKIFSKDGKVLSEAKEVSKVTKTLAKDTKENKK